ncbi:hypothetical protein ACFORH_42970 [Amycolatopsis roodepoortensis]|uniref:Tape measure protein n=1 Tax=Amycolatopsis roodepoortensis TaxID=700274 RepID=A0ABR9L471_9PSEU|nr:MULTISPECIES: hypothetical protein [Amycolatopsis]MBE1575065.1 hypothetical protein [Amycolatopsis roodepoortensis]GHG97564.1 hypothetical protein GCM10017788_77170 [Amycolatopsis acidiphila]
MASGERTVRIRFDGTAKGLAKAASESKALIKDVERAEAAAYAESARREKAAERERIASARAQAKEVADAEREITRAQREEIAKQKAAMKEAADAADDRGRRIDRLRNKILGFGKAIASKFSVAALGLSSINGLIGTLVGIVSWAGAASGALGLIPGVLAAGVAGMLAWKLGADGIKKAFEGVNPQLDALKVKVGATFQQGLAPAVRDINTLLPKTTTHFQGIARSISASIIEFTGMSRQKSNVDALNTTLDHSAGFIRNVGRTLAPLGRAFLDLAQVGSETMEKLTGGVGRSAQRFADFIREAKESGKIEQWISGGLGAFKDLWALLNDLASIVRSVFGSLQEGGAGVAPMLSPAIDAVRRFVQSPEGQETFRTLGEVLSKVGEAVSKILGPALEAVQPLIEPLGDLLVTIAESASDALAPALETLGRILGPLVKALSPVVEQLVKGLAPILPVLLRSLAPLAAALILLAPVIMLLNIPLLGAITMFTALAQLMQGDVVGAGQTMSNGLKASSEAMRTITQTNWGGMATDVMTAMSSAGSAVSTGSDGMSGDWGSGMQLMGSETSTALDGMIGKFGESMPQLSSMAGEGGLTAASRFGLGMDQMNSGARTGIGNVVAKVVQLPGMVLRGLGNIGSMLLHSGMELLAGFGRGIERMAGRIVDKVRGFVGRIRDMFPFSPAKTGPFSGRGWVLYSGMSIAESFGDGVLARTSSAVAAVRAMSGRVASAVPDELLPLAPSGAASGSLAASAAPSGGSATSRSGEPRVIELIVDLGKGITERLHIEIDEADRATVRAAGAGTGGMR